MTGEETPNPFEGIKSIFDEETELMYKALAKIFTQYDISADSALYSRSYIKIFKNGKSYANACKDSPAMTHQIIERIRSILGANSKTDENYDKKMNEFSDKFFYNVKILSPDDLCSRYIELFGTSEKIDVLTADIIWRMAGFIKTAEWSLEMCPCLEPITVRTLNLGGGAPRVRTF